MFFYIVICSNHNLQEEMIDDDIFIDNVSKSNEICGYFVRNNCKFSILDNICYFIIFIIFLSIGFLIDFMELTLDNLNLVDVFLKKTMIYISVVIWIMLGLLTYCIFDLNFNCFFQANMIFLLNILVKYQYKIFVRSKYNKSIKQHLDIDVFKLSHYLIIYTIMAIVFGCFIDIFYKYRNYSYLLSIIIIFLLQAKGNIYYFIVKIFFKKEDLKKIKLFNLFKKGIKEAITRNNIYISMNNEAESLIKYRNTKQLIIKKKMNITRNNIFKHMIKCVVNKKENDYLSKLIITKISHRKEDFPFSYLEARDIVVQYSKQQNLCFYIDKTLIERVAYPVEDFLLLVDPEDVLIKYIDKDVLLSFNVIEINNEIELRINPKKINPEQMQVMIYQPNLYNRNQQNN